MTNTTDPGQSTKAGARQSALHYFAASPAARAALTLIAVLVVGGLLQPSSVSPGAIFAILPYMAILAVASIGQHLVIIQRGLDISVAGTIALAAAIVSSYTTQATDLGTVLGGIGFALLAGAGVGLVNGLVIGVARVPPLVTTISTNSLLLGGVLYITDGTPSSTAVPLSNFALGRFLGLPNTFLVMAVVAAITALVLARTPKGRRFVAVGINARAANALGVSEPRYLIATYVLAGILFATSGVLLAGLLGVPNTFSGDPYILSSIAAVVIGGTSLGGGKSSVLATVMGAAFLTYLNQLVLTLGFATSMQFVVQAIVVIVGVALQNLQTKRS